MKVRGIRDITLPKVVTVTTRTGIVGKHLIRRPVLVRRIMRGQMIKNTQTYNGTDNAYNGSLNLGTGGC